MPAAELVEVDPSRWDELLRRLGVADVYYARGYAAASAVLVEAEPVLLHLPGDGGGVVFACLVRTDPADVVTPYGYGGPLAVGDRPPLDAFGAAYAAWCRRRGVVSSFVVYHPLYGNAAHARRLGGFRRTVLAGTVGWPLDAPDLLGGMHRHHRRLVRGALAAGLTASVDAAPGDLRAFVDLYEEGMRAVGAAPFYLFDAAYWDALRAGVPLVEVTVRDGDGRRLAGVLGMGAAPWMHYHLGASSAAGRGTGASHLALYTLARHAQEHGARMLHLGGGVGGRDDSLLQYKRRFAPDRPLLAAALGKAVHDEAAYARLTGAAEIDWDAFFPAYRAPR